MGCARRAWLPAPGWAIARSDRAVAQTNSIVAGICRAPPAASRMGDVSTTLEVWAAWLDQLGVAHTGIVDETEPITYSTIVFRDPDNIQLDLIAMEST